MQNARTGTDNMNPSKSNFYLNFEKSANVSLSFAIQKSSNTGQVFLEKFRLNLLVLKNYSGVKHYNL